MKTSKKRGSVASPMLLAIIILVIVIALMVAAYIALSKTGSGNLASIWNKIRFWG